MSNPITSFNDSVNRVLSPVFNYPLFSAVLCIGLVLYGPLTAPKLPEGAYSFFSDPYYRAFLLALMIYVTTRDIVSAMLVSAAYLVTIHQEWSMEGIRSNVSDRVSQVSSKASAWVSKEASAVASEVLSPESESVMKEAAAVVSEALSPETKTKPEAEAKATSETANTGSEQSSAPAPAPAPAQAREFNPQSILATLGGGLSSIPSGESASVAHPMTTDPSTKTNEPTPYITPEFADWSA